MIIKVSRLIILIVTRSRGFLVVTRGWDAVKLVTIFLGRNLHSRRTDTFALGDYTFTRLGVNLLKLVLSWTRSIRYPKHYRKNKLEIMTYTSRD